MTDAQVINKVSEKCPRLAAAINETVALLAKEKAYLPHNQDADRIAEYEAHLRKLWGMVVFGPRK